MSTAIKICGITSVEDAELARSAGADFLGLIFVEDSPRRVTLPAARGIVRLVRGHVRTVGVFKDSTPDEIVSLHAEVGFDLVQYHGSEPLELVKSVGLPSIKVVEISDSLSWECVAGYAGTVDYLLFDRPKRAAVPGWVDSALARLAAAPGNLPAFFFAGGLTPETVAPVVRAINPFGVDVASGVETNPGVKDAVKVRAFCQAVRSEDAA